MGSARRSMATVHGVQATVGRRIDGNCPRQMDGVCSPTYRPEGGSPICSGTIKGCLAVIPSSRRFCG